MAVSMNWQKSLGLNQFSIEDLQKRYVICTKHFGAKDYRNESSTFLNSNAMPNLLENEDNYRRNEKKHLKTLLPPPKKARIDASSNIKEEGQNHFVIINKLPKLIAESRLKIIKNQANHKIVAENTETIGEVEIYETPLSEDDQHQENYSTYEHDEIEIETLTTDQEQDDELEGTEKEDFQRQEEIYTNDMATQTEDREDAASNASTEGSHESKDDKLIKILYPGFVGMSKMMLIELVNEKNNRIQNLEEKISKLELAMRNLL